MTFAAAWRNGEVRETGVIMTELPGKALAQELMQQSRTESRATPMAAVIEAAREGTLQAEECFRLIGRLWTLERLFYYIYGGWGQGLGDW